MYKNNTNSNTDIIHKSDAVKNKLVLLNAAL